MDDNHFANLCKMLLEHKNYLAKLNKDHPVTLDIPFIQKYLTDIKNGNCNLHCYMEPDKYFLIVQEQPMALLIVDFWVQTVYRRKGIATKILSQLEPPVKLECFDNNIPAIELYKKLGFTRMEDWPSATNCHWWLKL